MMNAATSANLALFWANSATRQFFKKTPPGSCDSDETDARIVAHAVTLWNIATNDPNIIEFLHSKGNPDGTCPRSSRVYVLPPNQHGFVSCMVPDSYRDCWEIFWRPDSVQDGITFEGSATVGLYIFVPHPAGPPSIDPSTEERLHLLHALFSG